MEDKNLLLALALAKQGGGGGGSGLPDVTAEDNGKTLQVEEGNWQIKNADYTKKTVYFSGNATVVDLGGETYGFNLGQIEGLDSTVKTVTLTIANATESNTYTLTYDDTGISDMWIDPDNTTLIIVNGNFHLWVIGITDFNLGEVYNITLSVERVEPNFKAAVKKSIEPIQIDMPNIVFQKIQLALGQYATNVISNAGKICTLPEVVISYLNYDDPEEQAVFKSFSTLIANAATLNPETSIYFNGYLVTARLISRSGDSTIGGSMSFSFEYNTNNMKFNISFKITGYYSGDSIRIGIDVVYPVVLS